MSQGLGSKHDLSEFAFSKSVVEDFPKILQMLREIEPKLEKYRHYLGAAAVLESVYDAQTLLQMQYVYYNKVFLRKGKVTDE